MLGVGVIGCLAATSGVTTDRLALPGCGSPVVISTCGQDWSGWLGDRRDIREHGDDRGRPGPRFRNPQLSSTLPSDEAGGYV